VGEEMRAQGMLVIAQGRPGERPRGVAGTRELLRELLPALELRHGREGDPVADLLGGGDFPR
jgi:hypothetical protein